MANAPGQGRKPRSTHLKVVRGETNKDRLNTKEPKPLPKRPSCPRFLCTEGRKMWRYLAPQLERTGQLTRIDLGVFAAYCRVYGRWVRAEQAINVEGVLSVTVTGSVITNPNLWVANKCLSQLNTLGSALGLDPASRSRIIVDIKEGGDDFDDLLD